MNWKSVALGSAVLGAIGAAVFAKRQATASTAPRVALIGDSYAVGLSPQLAKIFPEFHGEGHVGIGASSWANHVAPCSPCGDWLAAFRPTIALVSLGVNDGVTPNPANYQAIVRELHGIGARVVWIEPPVAVNAPATRAMIASLGIPTVPATTTPLAADGLHPISYTEWAQEIAHAIDPSIGSRMS